MRLSACLTGGRSNPGTIQQALPNFDSDKVSKDVVELAQREKPDPGVRVVALILLAELSTPSAVKDLCARLATLSPPNKP